MKKLFCLFVLMFSASVFARPILMYEGLYFNPDASGRGVAVEIQEDTIVATFFGYKENGDAQWWQGVLYETQDGVYEGDFAAFADGQCFGCSYQPPSVDYSQVLRSGELRLLDDGSIKFSWPGGSDVLVKQNWAYANDLDYVYGMWMSSAYDDNMVEHVAGSVVFWGEAVGDGGERVLVGNVLGYVGTTSRRAVASDSGESAKDGFVYLLVELEYGESILSKFSVDEGRMIGTSILFDSNSNPVRELTGMSMRVFSGHDIGVGGDLKATVVKTAGGSGFVDLSNVDISAYNDLSSKLRSLSKTQ